MKILQITREFPPNVLGGVGYHAYYLARKFADNGHSVTVLTTGSEDHRTDSSNFDLTDIKIRSVDHFSGFSPRIWFARAVQEYIRQKMETTFDFIHSHEFINFRSISTSATTVIKIHYNNCMKEKYVTMDNLNSIIQPIAKIAGKYFLWPKERELERISLCTSDIRIYNSRLVKDIYNEEYNFEESDNDYKIIYNGIDTDRFIPSEQKINKPFWLFVGGNSKRKGYDILAEAVAGTEFHVKVVGDIQDSQKLTNNSNIEYIGRVNQDYIAKLLRNAKGLVHPARYEPFGNVILEALASGTPVVVSSQERCGAAEILTDDVGISVKSLKPSQVRDAMLSVENQSYSENDCRSVAEQYTWERTAAQTLELIDKS